MIFPMAVVPSLFGLWNMLWLGSHESTHLPIGVHGAVLPLLLMPLGATTAIAWECLSLGSHGATWFHALRDAVCADRAVLPGRSGRLLPGLEVHCGLFEPRAGDRVKVSSLTFALRAGIEEIFKPGALGMGGHRGLNLQRQSQRVAALASGHLRLAAGADGFQERSNLQPQRLAGRDGWLGEAQARIRFPPDW